MNKVIFLDRDGVLNDCKIIDGKPYAPRTLEEFRINPEIEQLHRLKNFGYRMIVTTNQPDVADKIVTSAFVEDLHKRLNDAFPFDDFLTCFHNDSDKCSCRKPKPGLLYEAHNRFNINMQRSFMIGDRWRDILAGTTAGVKTVFLDHGYKETTPAFHPNFTCGSLAEAIGWIETR